MSTAPSPIQWDSSHSHLLSRKAISEGWDTFFFFDGPPVDPGNLFFGINSRRFSLTKSEIFQWLGLMVMGDPSANLDPRRCQIEDADILAYVPINVESIPWETHDMQQSWQPGNYCIGMTYSGYYGAGDGCCTMQECERWGTVLVITGQESTCIIKDMKYCCQSLATTWIVAPNYYLGVLYPELEDVQTDVPENLILLPSSLIDDYKRHHFTVDVLRGNKIITFPGISAESEALLSSCSLQFDKSNIPFLRMHFRLSLLVHSTHGSISSDYQNMVEERLEMIEDGLRSVVEDSLDVALRIWLADAE